MHICINLCDIRNLTHKITGISSPVSETTYCTLEHKPSPAVAMDVPVQKTWFSIASFYGTGITTVFQPLIMTVPVLVNIPAECKIYIVTNRTNYAG